MSFSADSYFYFLLLCVISFLIMAKQKKHKSQEPESFWQKFLKIAGAIVLTFALVGGGYEAGSRITSARGDREAMQAEIDCQRRIQEARELWEREKRDEALIDGLNRLIQAANGINDRRVKENEK